MPQNLELKVKIQSISKAVLIARRIKALDKGILHQRDVYYNMQKGRLKLRIINNKFAELIFYSRSDKKGKKYSDYLILGVPKIKQAKLLLNRALGEKVVVVKKRRLFLFKNARIHIDEVKGLGIFLEFEVIVIKGKLEAQKLLEFLSMQFGIKSKDILAVSYSDLAILKRT
jgi:adenylate cyclase, class 2